MPHIQFGMESPVLSFMTQSDGFPFEKHGGVGLREEYQTNDPNNGRNDHGEPCSPSPSERP
jgi:hypothetical protein